MAGIGEDYHFDTLVQAFHLLFKLVNRVGRNALILRSKDSQNGRIDLL